MAGKSNSKLKLLYIADILRTYTDENHILSAHEICDKLVPYGFDTERKSIYSDIDILTDYGMDIIKTHSPKPGFFLGSGMFETAELRLLRDAVQTADFISAAKTKQLLGKLEDFSSVYQRETLKKQVYFEKKTKTANEKIYYCIDSLDEAIKSEKKVRLLYSRRRLDEKFDTRRESKEFVLSPYALVWSNDHYYLVANNEKYDNLMHLRVDRITSVQILKKDARPFREVSPYVRRFNTADYVEKNFNMFAGEIKKVELRCSTSVLEEMLDRFGERVDIRKSGSDCFILRTEAAITDGLVSWILQFGSKTEVLAPQELKNMLIERIKSIEKLYDI